MTFEDCVIECCMTKDFVKEYDRLRGSNLAKVLIPQPDKRSPIEKMIDKATGYDKVRTNLDEQVHKEMTEFIGFIFEVVWLPLLPDILYENKENENGKPII